MTEIVSQQDGYTEPKSADSPIAPQSKIKQYFTNYASRKALQPDEDPEDAETNISYEKTQFAPSNRPNPTWEEEYINSPCDRDCLVQESIGECKSTPFFVWRMKDNRHYGNCLPFCYIKGEPMCLVGPDCRFNIQQGLSV